MKDSTDNLKYTKWSLCILTVLSVSGWDLRASSIRNAGQIKENIRDLNMLWEVASDLVEAKGLEALPVQHQGEWETLDIYTINGDGLFASRARFIGDNWAKTKCTTPAATLALSGDRNAKIITDYRGESVISSFGPARLPDGQAIGLLVEMDVSEALGVAPDSYWDDASVAFLQLLLGLLINWVHRQRASEKELHQEWIDNATGVLAVNERLTEERNQWKDLYETAVTKYEEVKATGRKTIDFNEPPDLSEVADEPESA